MKESGHWYDRTGAACHTTKGANGNSRATTLRDARKLNLLPSVTTIFGVLAKPQLDDWKHRQITAAALREPRFIDEAPDTYHGRIMEEAFKQVEDAADLGTAIHKAIENHFTGLVYDPSMEAYVVAVDAWKTQEGVEFLAHELRLVSLEHGYAGTTDAAMLSKRGRGILDFKSRKTKEGQPVTSYDTQPMQIAAYHMAHYGQILDTDVGCNCYISTTEPGRVEAVWYDAAQLRAEWEAFKCAVKLWQHFKGYVPTFN
jgi:hypothetical protein